MKKLMWFWCASMPKFAWGENIRQPPTFLQLCGDIFGPQFLPCPTLFMFFICFQFWKISNLKNIWKASPLFFPWGGGGGVLFGQNYILVKKQETVLQAPNHQVVLRLLVLGVLSTYHWFFLSPPANKKCL